MKQIIKDKEGYVVYVDTYKYLDNEKRIKVIRGGKGRGPIIKAWLESYGLKLENGEEAENPNKVIGFRNNSDTPGLSIIIRPREDMDKDFQFESSDELDLAMSTQPLRDTFGEAMAQGSSLTQSPKPKAHPYSTSSPGH